MDQTSVVGKESEVHQRYDVDSGQFIVPLSLLRLPLDDVTAVEYCSIDVMFLPYLLHFHDDKRTVVQSTKDIENRSPVIDIICKLGGVDVFNRLNREFGHDRLDEADEDVGIIGIGKDSFESKVRHQRYVFRHIKWLRVGC